MGRQKLVSMEEACEVEMREQCSGRRDRRTRT